MDMIDKLEGVTINQDQVKFGKLEAPERFKLSTANKFGRMLSAVTLQPQDGGQTRLKVRVRILVPNLMSESELLKDAGQADHP